MALFKGSTVTAASPAADTAPDRPRPKRHRRMPCAWKMTELKRNGHSVWECSTHPGEQRTFMIRR